MLSEFDLIERYFSQPMRQLAASYPQLKLGIGDDCALLQASAGKQLAISSDMLVSGRHFFADVDAASLGHKALAVNLSDLAAMGARPLGFTLALALPELQPDWLAAFSQGLLSLAAASGCPLIGGDTTKGPLNISITVLGEVTPGQALRRAAAQAGDDIWVSGTLGGARLALGALYGDYILPAAIMQQSAERLHRPQPRLALGQALAGLAHAALDVSDGLLGDLGHILNASGLAAEISLDALPLADYLPEHAPSTQAAYDFALNGGDDYELCFTAPVSARQQLLQLAEACATPISRIGKMRAGRPGDCKIWHADGREFISQLASFDHFPKDSS